MERATRKEITIEPILWRHSTSKDGLHPIKLKLTANRRTKYYPIQYNNKNIMIPGDLWPNMLAGKLRGENRLIKENIEKAKVRALEVVEQLKKGGRPFSYERFETEYYTQPANDTFQDAFNKYLNNLVNEGRIGTYRSYKNALDALNLYLVHKKLKDFTAYDLTADLLKDFEKFLLLKRGKTTLGIYARTIRTIYNYCASQDYRLKELYPFGKGPGKYKISNSKKGAKKGDALTSEQLKKFILLTPDPKSPQFEAKMLWLFSFYCQGMNFKDICLLKYSNIQGQTIRYVREKTKRTEDNELIEISLTKEIKDIIWALGNEEKAPSSYVFDFLPANETDPQIIEPIILQKIKITNKWLKRLCVAVDLPPITTYWSRHTYASLLKFSGVPVEMIRELLGHSDVRTTEHYLKRFDLLAKSQINSQLLRKVMLTV